MRLRLVEMTRERKDSRDDKGVEWKRLVDMTRERKESRDDNGEGRKKLMGA